MGSAALLFGIYVVFGYFINISGGIVIEECRAHYPKDACYIGIYLDYYVPGCEEDYRRFWYWDLPILTFKFIGGHETVEFTVKQPETNTSWLWSVMAHTFTKEELRLWEFHQDLFSIFCTIETVNVREKSTLTCRGPDPGPLGWYRNRRFGWYRNRRFDWYRNMMNMSIETQNDGKTVCEEPYRYNQTLSYSCPYNVDETMTTKFKFMSTAICGINTTTEITVKVTGKNHNGSTALTEASTVPGKTSNASTDIDHRHKEKSEDDISITCEDVTGSVGEELILTCRVSDWNDICCVGMYTIIQTASNDSSTICRGFGSHFCPQFTSIFCSYTAKAAMTTKFKFFLQTDCGQKTSEFTVIVTDSSDKENVRQGEYSVLKVTAGCVLSLIVIALAIIGVIVWTRSSQVNRFLKGYLRGRTTDADSVSDQQMQRYASSESMDPPLNL